MPVTVHQLLEGAKQAAAEQAPRVHPDGDLPAVLVFAHGDRWDTWLVPANLTRDPASRELYGYVIPAFLRNHHAHAAALSFTAWVRPGRGQMATDPRQTLRLVTGALVKDAPGEREAVVFVGADSTGLVCQSKSRLKRRAMLPPHLGPFEDAPDLPDVLGRPGAQSPLMRALLVGVGAVGVARAA